MKSIKKQNNQFKKKIELIKKIYFTKNYPIFVLLGHWYVVGYRKSNTEVFLLFVIYKRV